MSSTSDAATKAHVLLAIDFEVNGYTLSGAYETTEGILAGKVDDVALKELAPADLVPFVPAVNIDQVAAFYHTHNGNSAMLADLGFELDLHDLPFIGSRIPAQQTFALQDLNIKVSVIDGKTQLSLESQLNILGQQLPLAIPITEDNQLPGEETSREPVVEKQVTKPGFVKWFDVNKTIGPGQLKRLGLQYFDDELHFLVDMQMSLGPLIIGLDGLSLGSPLDRLDPKFSLSGLSLSYVKGPTQVTGALLYNELDDSYQGLAVIKAGSLNIAALGGYKEHNGQPSLFIYGVSHFAVGVGPAFMQVTGLSAGFGYNRGLNIPKPSGVKNFPLVRAAVGEDFGTEPFEVLNNIATAVYSSPGELFVAFGVKFNSFKQIDAFALLTMRMGNRVKLDVLGMATTSLPRNAAKPLAVAELAIVASYDFEQQVLKVQGALTNSSYIFDKKCRLSGGFAFYSWFDGRHSGDFVLTLGGYHPEFNRPSHYPNVPRLGFRWKLSRALSLKGEVYYALVPGAMMAGGKFKALFQQSFRVGFDIGVAGATLSGRVKAYFIIGADFVVAWQPFSYHARLHLSIGIKATFRGRVRFLFFSATKTLNFDLSLGAGLRIWGPRFSGVAHVDWKVVSFDIKFGANTKPKPQPLDWHQFKQAFLPAAGKVASINVTNGLLRLVESASKQINIIEPTQLQLTTDAVVPSTLSTAGVGKSFGIASMDLSEVHSSEHHISILKDQTADVTEQFEFTAVKKSAPSALWGNQIKAQLNGGLLDNLLSGCVVTPKPKKAPDQSETKPLRDFSYDIELKAEAFEWSTGLNLQNLDDEPQAREALSQINHIPERANILGALGLDASEVSLEGLEKNIHGALLATPQVVQLA